MPSTVTKKGATTISDNGLRIIRNFEGLVLHPYKDQVGIPTIGYGSTHYANGKAVTMKDAPITKYLAEQLLKFEANAKAYVIAQSLQRAGVSLNQNQFDACVSLAYNIGVEGFLTSTVLRRIKANQNDPAIRSAFNMWVKGTKNGVKVTLPVLVQRRKEEADLYFS